MGSNILGNFDTNHCKYFFNFQLSNYFEQFQGPTSYEKEPTEAATRKNLDIDFKTVYHFYSGILSSNFDFEYFRLRIFSQHNFRIPNASKGQPATRSSQEKQWGGRACTDFRGHLGKYILLKFRNVFEIFTFNIFCHLFFQKFKPVSKVNLPG